MNTHAIVAMPGAFALPFLTRGHQPGQNHSHVAQIDLKKLLASKAFLCMTADRLVERDPNGEVRDWMVRLSAML